MKNISSLHNDTIKFITGLIQKTSLRKKSDVFVVEGKRELQLAHEGGFVIDKVFYCPHKPEDSCLCRKPNPGMIHNALKEFPIIKEKSIVIGDKITDIECGKRAKIGKSFLINNDSNNINSQNTYKSLFHLVCVDKLIK